MEEAIDGARLLRRVGGNRGLLTRLVRLALETAPEMMAEVRAAATRRDRAALGAALHSFRGAMALLAGETLGGLAVQLETMAREAPFDEIDERCDVLENEVRRCLAGLERVVQL